MEWNKTETKRLLKVKNILTEVWEGKLSKYKRTIPTSYIAHEIADCYNELANGESCVVFKEDVKKFFEKYGFIIENEDCITWRIFVSDRHKELYDKENEEPINEEKPWEELFCEIATALSDYEDKFNDKAKTKEEEFKNACIALDLVKAFNYDLLYEHSIEFANGILALEQLRSDEQNEVCDKEKSGISFENTRKIISDYVSIIVPTSPYKDEPSPQFEYRLSSTMLEMSKAFICDVGYEQAHKFAQGMIALGQIPFHR